MTYATVGQTIKYTYEIKNTGTNVLSGPFTVSDNREAVTCPGTLSLAPGASISCMASHIVTQDDLDARSITNTATASGKSVTSNQEQVTVTSKQITPIPEFPTVALPVIAVIGLMFLFKRRKG
jgi:hypothetical protein